MYCTFGAFFSSLRFVVFVLVLTGDHYFRSLLQFFSWYFGRRVGQKKKRRRLGKKTRTTTPTSFRSIMVGSDCELPGEYYMSTYTCIPFLFIHPGPPLKAAGKRGNSKRKLLRSRSGVCKTESTYDIFFLLIQNMLCYYICHIRNAISTSPELRHSINNIIIFIVWAHTYSTSMQLAAWLNHFLFVVHSLPSSVCCSMACLFPLFWCIVCFPDKPVTFM